MNRLLVIALVLFTAVARAQDRKPVIGVEADLVRDAKTGALEEHVSEAYLQAVRDAGGEPLVLSPLRMTPDQAIERVDGIVFTGGPDLPAALYGEKALTADKLVEPARLEFSKALFAKADARGVPMLGICLGNQLINVLKGGKLVQDIPTTVANALAHRKNGDDHDSGEAHHPIAVVKGSQLSLATGDKLDVNSFHHQAVEKPGSGLKAVAHAPEYVVSWHQPEPVGRRVTRGDRQREVAEHGPRPPPGLGGDCGAPGGAVDEQRVSFIDLTTYVRELVRRALHVCSHIAPLSTDRRACAPVVVLDLLCPLVDRSRIEPKLFQHRHRARERAHGYVVAPVAQRFQGRNQRIEMAARRRRVHEDPAHLINLSIML